MPKKNLQLKETDCFSQNPYFCSQLKDVVGVKIFFDPHSAFHPFSSKFGEYRVKEKVEERRKEEKDDVEIIATPKKRIAFKSKSTSKKKIA